MLETLGVIIALILFVGVIVFMCIFVTLGILYDEDPERAEELIKHWLEYISRNDNNMIL